MNASRSVQNRDDLEFRLRRIHDRQRRAFIRQAVGVACWSAGLLAMAAFVVALAIGAVSR